MKFSNLLMLIGAAVFFQSCNTHKAPQTMSQEEQLYRPNYHFTPKANWMNDPNGLYYLDGTYHLFFQYYPDGSKWGPMHWGHATSKDLVKWDEQEIALAPDELGWIFSGSAVVDKNNTSGFGDGKNVPVVAIYTYHDPVKEKAEKIDVESQGIAYSLDNGKTWTKYSANPVLKNPGIRDFRDPKVIWDDVHQQWLLVLAAQDRSQLYTSKNLKDWVYLSDFGKDLGAHGGVWECPDFFPMQVEGTNETKWVLIQSLNPGGANGGSGTQYFVGDFDGKTFKMDEVFTKQLDREKAVWLDWGMDNYASVSFDNVPGNKKIMIGWMSNWLYAQEVPTEGWRSSSTIAREVKLVKNNDGYTLENLPVSQLAQYEGKKVNKTVALDKTEKLISKGELDLTQSVLNLDLKNLQSGKSTFTLQNSLGEKLSFGIDNTNHTIFVDRTKSGKKDFSDKFSEKVTIAKLPKELVNAQLKVLLDKTSIEIFLNKGEVAVTEIFFPNESYSELTASSDSKGGSVTMKASQIKN